MRVNNPVFRSPSVIGGGIAKGFFLISFGKILGGGINLNLIGFYIYTDLNVVVYYCCYKDNYEDFLFFLIFW